MIRAGTGPRAPSSRNRDEGALFAPISGARWKAFLLLPEPTRHVMLKPPAYAILLLSVFAAGCAVPDNSYRSSSGPSPLVHRSPYPASAVHLDPYPSRRLSPVQARLLWEQRERERQLAYAQGRRDVWRGRGGHRDLRDRDDRRDRDRWHDRDRDDDRREARERERRETQRQAEQDRRRAEQERDRRRRDEQERRRASAADPTHQRLGEQRYDPRAAYRGGLDR